MLLWVLGVTVTLLFDLCGGVSVSLIYSFRFDHAGSWSSGFSHPGGFSFFDTTDDHSLLYTIDDQDSVSSQTAVCPNVYGRSMPINKNQVAILSPSSDSILLQYSTSTPPSLLSQQYFPYHRELNCEPTMLGSDGVGIWFDCNNYILYTTIASSGLGFSYTVVNYNLWGSSNWTTWKFKGFHCKYPMAIYEPKLKRVYGVATAEYSNDGGLFSFDVQADGSLQFSSASPFLFDPMVAKCCKHIHIAPVQQGTRLLVLYPYFASNQSRTQFDCSDGSIDKPIIGASLLDANTLKQIAFASINSQWYQYLGALTVGDDAVVVWSLPIGLVLYTNFNVFQVVGDSIVPGTGFQVPGSQLIGPSNLADVDPAKPLDYFFVALREPTLNSNSSVVVKAIVTRQ